MAAVDPSPPSHLNEVPSQTCDSLSVDLPFLSRIPLRMGIAVCVGKNIRRLRESKGLSQEAFAELAGLHRTYVSGIERGVRNPTLTIMERVADSLEVSIADLFSMDACR